MKREQAGCGHRRGLCAAALLWSAWAGCGTPCDPGDRFCEGTVQIEVIDDAGKTDGCQIDTGPTPIVGSRYGLSNDGRGNIELRGFGTGGVSGDSASLREEADAQAGDNCTYHYLVTLDLQWTGADAYRGQYVEQQSRRSSGCVPSVGADCLTAWNMTLRRVEAE